MTAHTALVLSQAQDFINRFSKLLKKTGFKVSARSPGADSNDTEVPTADLLFIDNQDGTIRFDQHLRPLFEKNPPMVALNFGQPLGETCPDYSIIQVQQEQVQLDSFLANYREFLTRAKSRPELAALIIHDIRSPLNSMLAYLELLLNQTFGELNEGQVNFLEKSMVLGDQILDMLEELNEVYRSEQYVFSLEKDPVQLEKIIDEALVNVWVKADQKNIQIKKDLPRKLPTVMVDAFQIQRVFLNLVGNAIKYCPPNSKVVIKARRTSDRLLTVSIMDNGGGIPEDHLSRIFKRAVRVEQQPERQEGYGLGLYICKLIVKAHGGTIHAENNPEGGVSFIFTLPTKK